MSFTPTFALAFASVLASTAIASADQPYHHAVSVQLLTVDRTGAAIQGEHDLGWQKLSIALAVGARSAARGEFGSTTLGAGLELRRWLRRPTTMNGWYVAVRTDLSRTSIDDMVDDRDLGSLVTWSAGASTGYRFVIRNRVEITPSIGTALVIEGGLDGMSPATARGVAIIGLTAGVTF